MTYDHLDGQVTNINKLRRAIELWDSCFRISYFQYRHRLKKISTENWPYPVLNDLSSIQDDDWIVPTDDDDWMSPDLEFPDADFVYWPSLRVHSCGHLEVSSNFDVVPESNAYAVRGRLLNKLNHVDRHKIIQEHQKSIKIASKKHSVVFIDKIFSAYNAHPGCAHILKSIRTKDGIFGLFASPIRKLECGWANPVVERFLRLYEEVNDSSK
jgi:hypothetical protein